MQEETVKEAQCHLTFKSGWQKLNQSVSMEEGNTKENSGVTYRVIYDCVYLLT